MDTSALQNPDATYLVVGNNYTNTMAAQIFTQYRVNLNNTPVVSSGYGNNRILIAGYTLNQTTQAGQNFMSTMRRSFAGPGYGYFYQGVPVIGGNAKPALIIVVGSRATPTDWTVALAIQSLIRSDSL